MTMTSAPSSQQFLAPSSSTFAARDDETLSPTAMPTQLSPAPSTSSLPNLAARQSRRSRVAFDASADASPSRRQSPEAERKPAAPRGVPRSAPKAGSEEEEEADETTAMVGREDGGNKTYNTQGPDQSGNAPGLKRRQSARSRLQSQIDGTVGGQEDDAQGPALTGWWRKLLDKYGSVELENKGSVARDHLALERTFLAWLRTSLSFASIGIAVTQLFRLNVSINNDQPTDAQIHLRRIGKPLGATFLAVGIVTLLIGFHRYFESQHYVILGKFPASRGSVVIITLCSAGLIIASFVTILVIGHVSR